MRARERDSITEQCDHRIRRRPLALLTPWRSGFRVALEFVGARSASGIAKQSRRGRHAHGAIADGSAHAAFGEAIEVNRRTSPHVPTR